MKKNISSFLLVLLLALLSVLIYMVQIMVFDSPHDTGFYILQDFAFLPLQISIVTVVLGRYLKRREKIERLKKINIVINAFFSEAGTDILIGLTGFGKNFHEIRERLNVQTDADIQIECSADQLEVLKVLMKSKRDFLIRLLGNPNLLEHDAFTDMLLCVLHVTEEIIARGVFDDNDKIDIEHLSNDIQRALKALLVQWVEYMRHLCSEYPYLYSFVVRKNPLSEDGNIMISE